MPVLQEQILERGTKARVRINLCCSVVWVVPGHYRGGAAGDEMFASRASLGVIRHALGRQWPHKIVHFKQTRLWRLQLILYNNFLIHRGNISFPSNLWFSRKNLFRCMNILIWEMCDNRVCLLRIIYNIFLGINAYSMICNS